MPETARDMDLIQLQEALVAMVDRCDALEIENERLQRERDGAAALSRLNLEGKERAQVENERLNQERELWVTENEQLKADNALAAKELVEYGKLLAQSSLDENQNLRAENERLKADLQHYSALEDVFEAKDAENERLKSELVTEHDIRIDTEHEIERLRKFVLAVAGGAYVDVEKARRRALEVVGLANDD